MSQADTPKTRLGNLDLLRLFAALMVVFYHLTYTGYVGGRLNPVAFPEVEPLTQHLWAGVSLFFILSGFVIAFSAERGSAYDFAVSRVARLYPAFLICMTATAVVLALAAPQQFTEFQASQTRWLANLTMVPIAFKQPFMDGVYWSIVTELTFYFWVTLLLALGLFHRHQIVILAVWLVLSAANELWLASALVNKLIASQYACYFVMGILSYRSFAGRRWPTLAEAVLAAAALALSLASDLKVQSWMIAHYDHAAEWSPMLSALKTLVFVALVNLAARCAPVLNPSLCLLLGGLTYPLYLLHANIGFTLFQKLAPLADRWLVLAGIVALMLGLSWLVYRFVEPAGRSVIYGLSKRLRPSPGHPLQTAG